MLVSTYSETSRSEASVLGKPYYTLKSLHIPVANHTIEKEKMEKAKREEAARVAAKKAEEKPKIQPTKS